MNIKSYEHVEVKIHADGTIRIYGNGGMIFETKGNNVTATSSIFPKPQAPSGTNG